ncbi:hypothetical protein COU87_05360 [Candidatus Roizmanbacteria bacterium CG10_big_fil_rev_8_21_14_0_10_39_12]|uniref:NAD-dependent epimerase/dehydratase domain-containing protein n=1 Tax=Candidatus Roizmanbacteria bacterium CG10_big_fil_rev_8_21_14_0_10_39_12 TaxID=1974852 RepID=A0A2M8KMY7_9BACT|nr:MAG: hypothetical protein COU87_05360 [Candidatus Roizmanbacteria bacterium CG10_big_fil_rev_8_21_14_0_10_39_12]
MRSLQNFMTPFYKNVSIINPLKLRKKTILITGCTGLIGANLVSFLEYLSEKHDLQLSIIGVSLSKEPSWMPCSPVIQYIQEDLAVDQSKTLSHYFDYFIHAATYAQPKKSLDFPQKTISLNTNTLINILNKSKRDNARVLYISSSEIYGETNVKNPSLETDFGSVNTLSDRAIYAESKRLAESICYLYHDSLTIKIARVQHCYGPGIKKNDKRVYSEFIKQAQSTGEITMMDEGTAIRTFCFISDTIEMLLNCMLSGRESVYNIAGRGATTIFELAQEIAAINSATFKGYRETNQEAEGTPAISLINNRRYIKEFKKRSFITLSEGLQATSNWVNNLGYLRET